MVTTSLTRSGYVVNPSDKDVKKELTVRPKVNGDFGFPPPPFKVFKEDKKKNLCMPQYYGREKFGTPDSDNRPEPEKLSSPVQFKGKLRTETRQVEAFDKAIEQGHGVLSLPCGFGKTTVGLAIACRLGYRTAVIVHKEFLMNQWKERIRQFCPNASIGIVQRNKVDINKDFVIIMLQSLSQIEYSFDTFETIGTVLVDEAHHICARVFSQGLFKMCPRHIYGLSATPDRKDGLTCVLNWIVGPVFFSVERENQAQIEVFPVPFDCPTFAAPPPCNRTGKISLPTMITMLTEMENRNKLLIKIIKTASRGTRKVLVLSDRREHCEWIRSKFPDISGLYMGGMKEAELQLSSEKKIIVGTFSQAHEGLDIPTLDTVILATPKSEIKQAIGRVMRETAGKKNNPHIWDFQDHWSVFNAMSMKRRKVYRTSGFLIHDQDQDEEDCDNFKGKCLL